MTSNTNYRLILTLSILVFLVPWTISDGANINFLYYINPLNFFICKILLGVFFPFLLFIGLEHISSKGKWILVFISVAGISFYMSQSILYASLIAITITLSWNYTQRALTESLYIIMIFSLVLVLYYQYILFGSFKFWNSNSSAEIIKNELSDSNRIQLPYNIYLIVFDELSNKNLYEGSIISNRFPHFKKLADESIMPPLATTNFDSTTPSILTLLRGNLAKTIFNSENTPTNFLEENLFDYIEDDHLYIWGWVEPYCRTLKAKQRTSYCLDEHKQLSNKSFNEILFMDFIRFSHIYLLNYPIGIIKSAYHTIDKFKPGFNNPALNSYLSALIAKSDSAMWKEQIPRDLDRLSDFIPQIGKHKNSLYYFHSALPHYAYFGDADLKIREDEYSIAFWTAESMAEHEKVTQAYERTIQAADTVLGKILDAIKKNDPDSLIIVTSDHGAAQDYDRPSKRPTGELLESVVEIPFFIKLPPDHHLSSETLSTYQHLDFLPTLYDILGHEKHNSWKGVSVFREETSEFYHESADAIFREYLK